MSPEILLNTKYLHQLHDEVKLIVSINLFNQKHNVGMFHTSKDGYFTLDHVLLERVKSVKEQHNSGYSEDTLVSPNSCEHEHADLSPAFTLADDLQSIFSPCGSLHTLSDDGKVSVPQSPPNFVPLCYGDGDGGVLIHQLHCGVTRDKIGKVKIETCPKIVIRSYLHCRDHRPHPWSCKPLWRLKKVKNHCAGTPEGKEEL